MLGLIGEYLGRMFLTVNQRPQSVVREVFSTEGAASAVPNRNVPQYQNSR
jgi:undecaprenyl-phosphate 4-deoxy-4-formamido-L-arabinose transferase